MKKDKRGIGSRWISRHLLIKRHRTSHSSQRWLIALTASLSAVALHAEVVVSSLAVAQHPGTKLVEISYDLACDGPNEIEIQLSISNSTVSISSLSAVGDIGTPILVGTGKTICWDMEQDWNDAKGNLFITVSAKNLIVGADPSADSWTYLNDRWVQNTYVDNSKTLTDRESGLMWHHYDIGYGGWDDALNACDALNYAGYNDWFLPDVDQLSYVYGQNSYLKNWSTTGSLPHWTSTIVEDYSPASAWAIGMQGGSIFEYARGYNGYIRPCRDSSGSTNSGYVAVSTSDLFDSRDYSLAILAQYGVANPANGTHSGFCWKSAVTCSVDYVATAENTNYLCTGWSAGGTTPSVGYDNTAIIVLDDVTSTLTWEQEIAHYIDFEISGNGTLNHTDGWFVNGTELSVIASPASGWSFWGWGGDFAGNYQNSNATLLVSYPKTISATFIEDFDQDHMDDGWEIQNYGNINACDPSDDPDGDRYTNLEEYLNNTIPTEFDIGPAVLWTAVEVGWRSVLNTNYQVQCSTNLTSGEWTDIGLTVSGNGSTNSLLFSTRDSDHKTFRVIVAP